MSEASDVFIAESRRYLTDEYLPKIRRCLEVLSPEDIWWRPNPESNSVGNLVVHLAGNLRQWVVSAIGGAPDVRERQEEFDRRGGLTGAELIERIAATVADADRALTGLDPASLLDARTIQGQHVTVLRAIYHAVEHFGMHTGQIVWITKLRTGRDLGFYRVEGRIVSPAW